MRRFLPILLFAVCSLNGGLALLQSIGSCSGGKCTVVETRVCSAVGTCSDTNSNKDKGEKKSGKKPACCVCTPNCCVYIVPVTEWPVWFFRENPRDNPQGRQRCMACSFTDSVWRPPDAFSDFV